MINIPGNPANYPANVRAIEDGDVRGEVNSAAATEDLADRTANIDARLTAALVAKGFYAGLSKSISDNTHTGPSPQTVNNTPRQIFDVSGSPLAVVGPNVEIGDQLLVNVGPINLVSVDTVLSLTYVQLRIAGASYTRVFESIANTSGTAVPFEFQASLLFTAPAAHNVPMSLWAWSANTTSNLSIYSVCNGLVDPTPKYNWPNEETTGTANQAWGSIIHFGAGT